MGIDPASLAVKAVLMGAQMALTASQRINGPRLKSLDVQLADYATRIPHFWGTVRLDGLPIIWAEKLRHKKVTSKTKGGKYAEHKYWGTWGWVVCDHPFDAVSRMWLDKHLVYDATGVGPITPVGKGMLGERLKLGQNMRVYLGSEDQDPDPRYTAWCEDNVGPNSATAFRGYGYMVLEEIPLEKFGNRVPQATIEAVRTKTDAFPHETITTSQIGSVQRAKFGPNGRMVLVDPNDALESWDMANRTPIAFFPTTNLRGVAIDSQSQIYGLDFEAPGTGPQLLVHGMDGGVSAVTDNFDSSGVLGDLYLAGKEVCFSQFVAYNAILQYDPRLNRVVAIPTSFAPSFYFTDTDKDGWAVGWIDGEDKVVFRHMPSGEEHIVVSPTTGPAWALDNGEGGFLTWQNSRLFLVDTDTWTAGADISAVTGSGADLAFRNVQPGAPSIWLDTNEYDTRTATLIRSVDITDWSAGSPGRLVYDPINHALIGDPGAGITWYYLDRVGSAGMTLADVLEETATLVGIEEVDASAQTQTIHGYSVVQGNAKDWIGPLLDLHDVDPRPHNFGLQFVNRGGASGGTIYVADLVRNGDEARYVVSVEQDTDLPRRITVTFADRDKDHQANAAVSQRPFDSVDSVREETIDMKTYVSLPDEAQQLADRRLRRIWNGRGTVKGGLTAQELAIEPADVRTLQLDDVSWTARLLKMTLSGGAIQTEWERDFPGLHSLNGVAGAEMEGRLPEVIYVPGQTRGFALDIPLVRDSDENVSPLIYTGAGSYGVGAMPGAVIYRDEEEFAGVDSSGMATWGYATVALPTADPWLWDRGNSLTVKIYGTLTSVTEAEINADPSLNLFALQAGDDWELGNFATATLTGTEGTAKLYTLTGLKRGRRGTEGAIGSHTDYDAFVLIEDLAAKAMGASDIGDSLQFKAQTYGLDPEDAPLIVVPFEGNSLKPRAPVIWHVLKDSGTGDITIAIRSRTRVGGNWNGSTIPTGETIEQYEFDVTDGGEVVRTLTSADKTFSYSSADQTADFGGSVGADELEGFAYQLSNTVGRGFAQAA